MVLRKTEWAGFMLARKELSTDTPIRLDEKRLLSVDEFCTYASIGRSRGMDMAEASGSIFQVGKRVNIDRVKFDRWCDNNTVLS